MRYCDMNICDIETVPTFGRKQLLSLLVCRHPVDGGTPRTELRDEHRGGLLLRGGEGGVAEADHVPPGVQGEAEVAGGRRHHHDPVTRGHP